MLVKLFDDKAAEPKTKLIGNIVLNSKTGMVIICMILLNFHGDHLHALYITDCREWTQFLLTFPILPFSDVAYICHSYTGYCYICNSICFNCMTFIQVFILFHSLFSTLKCNFCLHLPSAFCTTSGYYLVLLLKIVF